MSAWRLAQVNQILHWAEDGHLNRQQVARLDAIAPLSPQRLAWLVAGERLCLSVGTLFLACAVVFFFAYNWDDLHRYSKLALAATALLACVAAALASRRANLGWQVALFGAMLCTGALLALIGQTYQTGADIWELFAAWTVLMLPFALLARTWPSWLLCLLVSNLWFIRWLMQDTHWWLPGFQYDPGRLAMWLGLNTLWWLIFVAAGRWLLAPPGPSMTRITAALALSILTLGAMLGALLLGYNNVKRFETYLLLFMPVAGTGLWYYRQRRLDIVMLGMLGVATTAVAGSLLARTLSALENLNISVLVMAGFVMAASATLSVWLKNLYRQQHRQASVVPGSLAATDLGPQA